MGNYRARCGAGEKPEVETPEAYLSLFATPENFVKILAVARSRNISCDIILQNISQIKSKYKDDWETIIGNCDSFVYLGGNDYSTFEYISKLLGKQTIRTKGQIIGKGSHGSSSDSYQVTGRDMPYLFVKSSVALNLS